MRAAPCDIVGRRCPGIGRVPAPLACSVYFVVDDADALCAWHRSNGIEIVEPPRDQPYRLRDYAVRDLDGYYLYFGHRLPAERIG